MFGTDRFIIVLLALMFVGCAEDPDPGSTRLYAERLANVLELDDQFIEGMEVKLSTLNDQAYELAFGDYQAFIALQERFEQSQNILRQDTAERIDVLEFLSLYGCEVQLSIARKNSSLGKFAPASQKLIESIEFLEHSPSCIESLKAEEKYELANRLETAYEQKQSELIVLSAEAILFGEEARQFWKPNTSIEKYPEQVSYEAIIAINSLSNYLKGLSEYVYHQSGSELEQALSILRIADGGDVFYAMHYFKSGVLIANELIEQRISRGCQGLNVSQMMTRVDNVVQKFFVAQVQVWAAQVTKRYYELMPAYREMEVQFEKIEFTEYQEWVKTRDTFFESVLETSRSHVLKVQELIKQC